MRRRTFFSALAAMFTALVLSFTMGTSEALAQQDQNCCKYIIDVENVPKECLPFELNSFWANGFPIEPITANGVNSYPLPWPCPPSSVFFGASINGQFPIATFGNIGYYKVNGCCLQVRIGFDGGCARIHVRPC